MKIAKKILAVTLGIILLTGCDKGDTSSMPDELIVSNVGGETEVGAFPVEICGTELSAAAERVVSLSPAVTEIIAEIGFADRLCGISSYCDYPENMDIPAFGSSENPDIEGIIAATPDVVFTLSGLAERDVYALEAEGIAVVQPTVPASLEEYARLYKDISAAFCGRELTDSEKETEKAALIGNTARTALEAKADNLRLGSFVYVTGKTTIAGGGTFENAVLSLVGENLCDAEGYCSAEELGGERLPDYVVADGSLSEEDLYADEIIAAMLYEGAQPLFVTARCFERPTARTAEVFAELSAQINAVETTEEAE